VRRHLAATGVGVVGCANALEKHFVGCCAQAEAQRAVAVIRIEPVIGRLQSEGRGHADGFVAGARYLKENLLLAFEQDLAIVDTPGGVHDSVGFDQLLPRQALVFAGLSLRWLGFGSSCHQSIHSTTFYCKC
jgi:hypothetical protein